MLQAIVRHISRFGWPPTRAEIALATGLASTNAVEAHLRGLQRKGYLFLAPTTPRGIRVLRAG